MRKIMAINKFHEEFDWLSNFFPCQVKFEGLTFTSSEAAFQAAKCADQNEREKFVNLSAGRTKRLGKKVNLREDWNRVKIDVMREVLICKFSQNPGLKEKLIATGNEELIEGNNWNDRFWGVCRGVGQNHLGKLLMDIRRTI
tara:strand:- start:54 stop:479 length:426 start_codon:yes stop_codon:yes gene_type:complete